MKTAVLALGLALLTGQACAASSEKISKECSAHVAWAGEVFDLITENPKVILNGMDKEDTNNFIFVRKWVDAGKTKDDLQQYVYSKCPGST